MRRSEGVIALSVSGLMISAGLVWLFGPYGLIASGVVLAALVLFVMDVKG